MNDLEIKGILLEWDVDHSGGTSPFVTFERDGIKIRVEFRGGVEWVPSDESTGIIGGWFADDGDVVYVGYEMPGTSFIRPVEHRNEGFGLYPEFVPFIEVAKYKIESQKSPHEMRHEEEEMTWGDD